MSAIFSNPFFIAACNARTRAMVTFGVDIDELDLERVRRLYLEVIRRSAGEDMERIIELVLNLNEPFASDAARGAYKIAIGMSLHEVHKLRKKQLGELEKREPPFHIYEQEM